MSCLSLFSFHAQAPFGFDVAMSGGEGQKNLDHGLRKRGGCAGNPQSIRTNASGSRIIERRVQPQSERQKENNVAVALGDVKWKRKIRSHIKYHTATTKLQIHRPLLQPQPTFLSSSPTLPCSPPGFIVRLSIVFACFLCLFTGVCSTLSSFSIVESSPRTFPDFLTSGLQSLAVAHGSGSRSMVRGQGKSMMGRSHH